MGIFLSIEHSLNLQEVHWAQRFISIMDCAAPLGGDVCGGRGQQPGGSPRASAHQAAWFHSLGVTFHVGVRELLGQRLV